MKVWHVSFFTESKSQLLSHLPIFNTMMFQKNFKALIAIIYLLSVSSVYAQVRPVDSTVSRKASKPIINRKTVKADSTKKALLIKWKLTAARKDSLKIDSLKRTKQPVKKTFSKADSAKKAGITKSPIAPKKNTSSKVDTLKNGTLIQKPNTSVLKKVMNKQDTTKKTVTPKSPIKGKIGTAAKLDTTKKTEVTIKGKPKSTVKVKLDSLKKEIPIQKTSFDILSPDKKISVNFKISRKKAWYSVKRNKETVLDSSKLGLMRDDDDYTTNFTIVSASAMVPVSNKYEMLTAKRKVNTYKANKQIFHLQNGSGHKLDVIFQVSNDGLAFKYFFPDSSKGITKIEEEITSFNFPDDTKAWLQPMSVAKTGWERTNPSYEEYYQKDIDAGKPAPNAAGWAYPALFKTGNNWALITESGLEKNYCATRLKQKSPNNEYSVGFPQAPEGRSGGPVDPEAKTPWLTPWRVISVGSLKTIVESTLGTDLAKPAIYIADPSFIKPGKASWSWIILKDSSIVYDVQKQFIDFAADMKWEYCLVDADWDKHIGYEKMKELADYAKTKNVGLFLWYNSAGDWNTVKYTPKDKLLTTASRAKEFAKLKEMGIKGVKVDFFGGDGQSVIKYYQDLFADAAKYQLMVNCHGATLPRGLQRTYPNLMTVEAIKGEEFITFDQANADEEPAHATTIPFTRNVFDPMDFTPMNLTGIPNINRKTSSAFELALPIIFQSGIQHLAETPEGMAKVPDYVKTFLQALPSEWLDTKFIDGYPGKFTVLARKAANGWYIAGINGENTEREVKLDMSFLTDKTKGILITDGSSKQSFDKTEMTFSKSKMPELTIKPNGGFVIYIKQ